MWVALGEAFGIVVVISAIGILHIPKEMVISGHTFGFAFRKLLLCCGAWISGLIERFVAEAGAAVLFDEGQGFVDSRDIRCTPNHSSLFLLMQEPGRHEPAQVEGECRGRHIETGLQFADREPFRPGPNQKADDLKAGEVAEFGKASGGCLDVHAHLYNRVVSPLQL